MLVDPKQVELNHYERLPHLLTPVVTSPRLAANVLSNLIGEMETRYAVMSEARARNLAELNKIRRKAGEAPLPHILCVIDELADLMMVAPAEVEDSIIRLAQKSRADRHPPRAGDAAALDRHHHRHDQGQHPLADRLRRRLPDRLARDPRPGRRRERCSARATCSSAAPGTSKLQPDPGRLRHRGRDRPDHQLLGEAGRARVRRGAARGARGRVRGRRRAASSRPDQDDLLDEAIRLVVETETASVSMIQRRLRVGYTRAGRLIDMLERRGDHLRLRGLEAAPGADHAVGPAAAAAANRRQDRRRPRRPSEPGTLGEPVEPVEPPTDPAPQLEPADR